MKCYYEVLGVERDADESTIKKAYRKVALQLHPDKNPDRIEECTQLFHEVQAAYDVLSDKQERAFYDKHREAILKGADDYVDDAIDLMQYFNASVYKGFDDSADSFYTIYRGVFRKIAEEDEPYLEGDDDNYFVPEFGESTSDYDETVKPFYSYWLGYCTKKSYTWKEKYDIRQAPNRPTQRLMEKENKKLRDSARRSRNEEVRALVAFVRKRDKRVIEYRKTLEQKQEEQKKKFEEKREEARRNRNKMLEDYKEQEWMSLDNDKLDDIDAHFDEEFGTVNKFDDPNYDSDNDKIDQFYCIACDKTFKSEKALTNHEKSKKHKENVELIKNEMEDELLEDLRVEDVKIDDDGIRTDEANSDFFAANTSFNRVSSLNLVENAVKLNIIEKGEKPVDGRDCCPSQNGLKNTTDSLVYAKLKGVGSKGSVKVKEKKKGKTDRTDLELNERLNATSFNPKNSLYLPRRKSKKQQIYDSAERLRMLNKLDQQGLEQPKLGGSHLADSIRLTKRKPSKADRKKARRELLQNSDDDSSSSEAEEVFAIANIVENSNEEVSIEDTNERVSDNGNEASILEGPTSPLLQRSVVADSIRYNKEKIELHGKNVLHKKKFLEIVENDNSPNGTNSLSRTTIADSIRYNKEKIEHRGKNSLYQKKFQEILEEDDNLSNSEPLGKKDRRKSKKSQPDDDNDLADEIYQCGVCMKDYPSRNKLFQHIKLEGHALLKEGNEKKKKKSKGKKT